jgi:hypothetical protein
MTVSAREPDVHVKTVAAVDVTGQSEGGTAHPEMLPAEMGLGHASFRKQLLRQKRRRVANPHPHAQQTAAHEHQLATSQHGHHNRHHTRDGSHSQCTQSSHVGLVIPAPRGAAGFSLCHSGTHGHMALSRTGWRAGKHRDDVRQTGIRKTVSVALWHTRIKQTNLTEPTALGRRGTVAHNLDVIAHAVHVHDRRAEVSAGQGQDSHENLQAPHLGNCPEFRVSLSWSN